MGQIDRGAGRAEAGGVRRRRSVLLTLVVGLVLAACGGSGGDGDDVADGGEPPQSASSLVDAAGSTGAVSTDVGPAGTSDDGSVPVGVEELVEEIVADLNDYWSIAADELGFDYEPVPPERLSTGEDGVECSGVPIEPEEVEENAYVDPACAEGITVAYDPVYVGESLARAEATMAHEWGHVIQAQAEEIDISLDAEGLPIDAELQADCFSGAWAAERATAPLDLLREDTADVGDPDDVEIDDPEAHGLPEERVTAFEIGLEGGPVACVVELLDALP